MKKRLAVIGIIVEKAESAEVCLYGNRTFYGGEKCK